MYVGIIDYGLGNIKSVKSAFEFLGYETILCKEKKHFEMISHIVLPGVGAFERGINLIQENNLKEILDEHVCKKKKPTLGICLGLQLMANNSLEYGNHKGLSWIEGEIIKLPVSELNQKLPNIGWESVSFKDSPLFDGIKQPADFYFVHSFHLHQKNKTDIIASYQMGEKTITAAIQKDNIIATQFHPEKSQDNGLRFIENFMKM